MAENLSISISVGHVASYEFHKVASILRWECYSHSHFAWGQAEFTKGGVIMPCAVSDLAALIYLRQTIIHIQPSADGLCNMLVFSSLLLPSASKWYDWNVWFIYLFIFVLFFALRHAAKSLWTTWITHNNNKKLIRAKGYVSEVAMNCQI